MIYFEEGNMELQLDAVQKCINFLHSSERPEIGKSAEIGDGIRCIVSRYDTKEESEAMWEAHRKYIDMHCVLEGEEKICVASTSQCVVGSFCEEKDYLSVEGVAIAQVMIKPRMAVCLFPNDAHQAKVMVQPGKPVTVTKVVFKIPVVLMESGKQ